MSDNIPFEIQVEIMKFLPIKSLIQFRSVSKQWNSLITSSDFIADYHVSNTQPREHLFVSYLDRQSPEQKFVSFVDDDTFPITKFSPEVPLSVSKLLDQVTTIGSSNGLFCLYNTYQNHTTGVIWNPTIRKSLDIDLGIVFDSSYKNVIGFGVSPHTLDPMIVKVTFTQASNNKTSLPWKVEVFTISSGVWRSPLCNSLPRESIKLTSYVVDINGFLYFLADEWIVIDQYARQYFLIISFDLKTEEFAEIRLPNSLNENVNRSHLSLHKLQDSVAVFDFCSKNMKMVCNVWMMDNDVQRSLSKLFTINLQNGILRDVIGFRKSGELLIEVKTGIEEQDGLYIYEPYSKHMSYIGILGRIFPYYVSSYVETLLLLNH